MSDERKEIRRPITLFVDEVLTEIPDLSESFVQPRRNVRLEMSKYQAQRLRDQLNAQIERDLPGSIGVQLKGHMTI